MTLSAEDPETSARIEELLAANGLAVSDIAIGFGTSPDLDGSITAIRFPGANAMDFLDIMISSTTATQGGEPSPAQVAGKDVTKITSESQTSYVYPQGDVIWLVVAEEPLLSQIFEALP
jgi:hypothetical protein